MKTLISLHYFIRFLASGGAGRRCSTASWTPGTARSACPPSPPPSLCSASWAGVAAWGPDPGCSRSRCGRASLEEKIILWERSIIPDVNKQESKKEHVRLTGLCQQQVVQVSVSYSQDVGDDAVTSWRETTLVKLLGSPTGGAYLRIIC